MKHTDQLGRTITLMSVPQRIISLVPSQTELLYDLGLDKEVVGITKFCIHPQSWFRSKKRVGGTKQVDLRVIKTLRPDLIIANKEENTLSDIQQLEQIAPVWISDVNTLDEALTMIECIGEITGTSERANTLVTDIRTAFLELPKTTRSVLYFIWKNPDYLAGRKTFIDSMLKEAGYINVCKRDRYPEIDYASESNPDYVFLSSEPYPFKEVHLIEYQNKFPDAKLRIVDGEMFSWYGSRLLLAPDYFRSLTDEFSDK